MSRSFFALHGFLGNVLDWDKVPLNDVEGVKLENFSSDSLEIWAKQFNQFIQEKNLGQHRKPILMGYSLGGRLALHALIANPSLYQSAIIVSAHPGLSSHAEKQKRLKSDEDWASRFEKEEWVSLMDAWNHREVFGSGCYKFERYEKDYDRRYLGKVLREFSLGLQEDLRQSIQQLPIPILWVVGEKDKKYMDVANSVRFDNPQSKVVIVPEAGHRVPWEQSEQFRELIRDFSH